MTALLLHFYGAGLIVTLLIYIISVRNFLRDPGRFADITVPPLSSWVVAALFWPVWWLWWALWFFPRYMKKNRTKGGPDA